MADPKYVNLPGIALDQPDSYETPDLPESDQYIDFSGSLGGGGGGRGGSGSGEPGEDDEPENPHIERPSLSVESAFERFRLMRLDGAAVDFLKNRGYGSDGFNGNFAESDRGKETLGQRLARLKLEVKELGEEFKASPAAAQKDTSQIQDLHQLEKELTNLVNCRTSPDSIMLKNKLESFPEAADRGKALQYELLLEKKLSGAGGNNLGQKAVEMESRIQRLEQVLGTSKDSLASLGLQKKNTSVLGALTVLHTKLSLLEPSHIEILEAKLSSVLQKVNSIIEKKLDVQELERTLKLSSLYDLLESSASTIEALPELSQRLDSLKELHAQASLVVRELNVIKTVQDGMTAGMMENEKLLKDLKTVITQSIDGSQ